MEKDSKQLKSRTETNHRLHDGKHSEWPSECVQYGRCECVVELLQDPERYQPGQIEAENKQGSVQVDLHNSVVMLCQEETAFAVDCWEFPSIDKYHTS